MTIGSVLLGPLVKNLPCTDSLLCQLDTVAVRNGLHPMTVFLIIQAGFGRASGQQGTLTPRTLNSLSAIAGHEGEEEDWERDMRDLRGDDEVSLLFFRMLPEVVHKIVPPFLGQRSSGAYFGLWISFCPHASFGCVVIGHSLISSQ